MPSKPLTYCWCGQSGCQTHTGNKRRPNSEVQKLYKTARWLRLRVEVLTEEPFCRDQGSPGCTEISTEADHIRPHNGDLVLFWMRSNITGRCRSCHARKTRRGE